MTVLFLLYGVLLAIGPINASNKTEGDLFDLIVLKNDSIAKITDDYVESLENEVLAYLKNGVHSNEFETLNYQLKSFRNGNGEEFFKCVTCRAIVNVLIRIFNEANGELHRPDRKVIIRNFLMDFCKRFNLETEEVCAASFDLNWPYIEYVVSNSVMSSRTACGIMIETSFCRVNQTEFNFSIDVDANGTKYDRPKSNIPNKGDNDSIVLHLTDIHYSPLYSPGNLAECDEPLCCRYKSDLPLNSTKAAGKWSDYRKCDTPWEMFTDSINQIKMNHPNIHSIYLTGDIIDHSVWETSQKDNMKYLSKVYNYLKESFGEIPLYPIIGNHEPHPFDLFSPPGVPEELSVSWLYKHLADLWSVWLPQDTRESILAGGYYTVSPHSGFRIIALNNNDCYIHNWWLFFDGSYLSKQLQWLHDTLLAAEKAKEYVHILAHVPAGRECWTVWTREFNRIVERFAETISGIFNGHTHVDEMTVFYTSDIPQKAINIAWNGGSLTAFINKNPNYRIYEVERNSFQVVDHQTWIFNVTEANQHPDRSPRWFKEYTFKEEFDLKDLSPASIDELLTKFAENPQLLRKYWTYQMTLADPSLKAGCDEKCLSKHLCQFTTSYPKRLERCLELKEKLHKALAEEKVQQKETPTFLNSEMELNPGRSSLL